MTTTETHDAMTAEATAVERFLRALEYSGSPALAAAVAAVKDTFETRGAERPPCMMKFSLKQDALLKALTLVMKTTSQRSTLEVLGHFFMVTRPSALESVPAQVIFTGTNLETGISIQVDAEVEREGAFTVPAKALLDCVKTFPKGRPVTIEVQAPRVLVSCGKRNFKLNGGLDASEFPLLWQEMVLGKGAAYVVGSDRLRQAIKEVQFVTRLVDGTFPDYAGNIPATHTTTFRLERKQLEQVLQAFKPFLKYDTIVTYSEKHIRSIISSR